MTTRSAETTSCERIRGITIVWIVLCGLTVGAWWLSPAHPGEVVQPNTPITVMVTAVAFVKCRLVIRHFMEVRSSPWWLQAATDGWLIVLWLAVLVIYLV